MFYSSGMRGNAMLWMFKELHDSVKRWKRCVESHICITLASFTDLFKVVNVRKWLSTAEPFNLSGVFSSGVICVILYFIDTDINGFFASIQTHTVSRTSYTGVGKNNPIRLNLLVYFTCHKICMFRRTLLFKMLELLRFFFNVFETTKTALFIYSLILYCVLSQICTWQLSWVKPSWSAIRSWRTRCSRCTSTMKSRCRKSRYRPAGHLLKKCLWMHDPEMTFTCFFIYDNTTYFTTNYTCFSKLSSILLNRY